MDKKFNIRGVAVYAKPANHDEVEKRAVIYTRTNRDKFQGQMAINSQITICKEHIKSQENLNLSHIYTEYGLPAIGVKQQNGFNALMQDAKLHKFDIIVAMSMSVISRNTFYLLKIMNEMTKIGVDTYFVKENMSMEYVRKLTDTMINYYFKKSIGEDA